MCSMLTPVSRPAVPSLNSSTTGPVLLKCSRWRQRSRTARAHMPEFCAQADSDAAEGTVSPDRDAELVRIEFHAVVAAGHDHGEQARMDRDLASAAGIDRRAGVGAAAAGAGFRRGVRLHAKSGGPARAGRRSFRQVYPRAIPLRGRSDRNGAEPSRACLPCQTPRMQVTPGRFLASVRAPHRPPPASRWPPVHEPEYASIGPPIST